VDLDLVHIVVMAGERWSQPQFVPHKRWWGSAEICTSTRCLELCSITLFFSFSFILFNNLGFGLRELVGSCM
jgi:hypothetical protein